MKTGFTNGANRCLVTSVKRDNMDIISVVLGADTKKYRTKDSIKIIEYAFNSYTSVDVKYMLCEKFNNIIENTKFEIEKGKNNELMLDLKENEVNIYPVEKTKVKDIKCEANIQNNLKAPIFKGDKIGKITIKIGEDIIYEVDILANNDIPKKNILDYLREIFTCERRCYIW